MIEINKNENKKNIEKNTEKENVKTSSKKSRKFLIMGIMWICTIVLGVVYYNINQNSKNPKIVFTRADEAPKDLKDRIYIYYPKNNSIENMEIVVPKIEDENGLLTATIRETAKKLEIDGIIPMIEEKDINYYMTDDKVYLDLPEKVFDKVSDAKSELLIIYSFVNSLTTINGIEKVRILINGMDIERVKYANLNRDYIYRKTI